MLKIISNGMELSILRLFYLLGLFMEDFLFGKDMKAYTDISQSAKLAKILPLESADMALCSKVQPLMTNYISAKKKFSNVGEIPIDPCWSLAALLDVLHNYTLQTNSDGSVFVVCDSKKPMISDSYKNPVDACVDMILLLKEKNLI